MYYVYLLKCSDGKPYTGCTENLEERISKHNKGQITATKDRLPARLISYFACSNKYTAFNFEKYLKSGSGRAFIKKHQLDTARPIPKNTASQTCIFSPKN